jgi:hypothetical protein
MSEFWPITLFVVYENPRDFPGKFVVRRWLDTVPEQKPVAVTEQLDQARAAIPAGAANIGRMRNDDPSIREVWL